MPDAMTWSLAESSRLANPAFSSMLHAQTPFGALPWPGQVAAGSLEDVGNVPEDSEEAFGGTPSAELEWSRKLCSGMMCLIGGRCMSQIFCRLHSQLSIWQLSREPFAPVPPFVHGEGSGKDCARGFGGKVLLQVAERFQNGTGYSGKRCWSFDNPYLSRDMRV